MEFFGGQVFNLPIEVALERGFLVPYYYHPIYVYARGARMIYSEFKYSGDFVIALLNKDTTI